ncbi:MAG TPA: amino acid carrier protein, partial [Armatimonadota bacterium]|nr:amino acid carrier protein [Armatimonadota bacterium]
AIMFAFCTMIATFGIGCMTQSNSVADSLHDLWNVPPIFTGIAMAALVAAIVFGGIRRIGKVAERLIPVMCVIYVIGAIVVLARFAGEIPGALALIVSKAFTPQAGMGAFMGVTVRETMRQGVARGLFSNEGGLGSASIAHSAAKTKEPVREGLVAMVGPLIDTLIICTMTAVVIIVTGAWTEAGPDGLLRTGAPLSARAFELGFPKIGAGEFSFGPYLVTMGLALFAFSTVLSWPYYGDRSAEYLFGRKAIPVFRWMHVVLLVVGSVIKVGIVWDLTDIMNGLMAFPNLIGIVCLSGILVSEVHKYFSSDGPNRLHGDDPPDEPPIATD